MQKKRSFRVVGTMATAIFVLAGIAGLVAAIPILRQSVGTSLSKEMIFVGMLAVGGTGSAISLLMARIRIRGRNEDAPDFWNLVRWNADSDPEFAQIRFWARSTLIFWMVGFLGVALLL